MACPACGQSASAVDGSCAGCGFVHSDGDIASFQPTVLPELDRGVSTSSRPDGLLHENLSTLTVSLGLEATRIHAQQGRRPGALPIAIGRRVANRYRISRLIGVGGMGVVYQAWDEKLNLEVALKVILKPEVSDPFLAADLERRFLTELLLSRRVTHKNVVRIHDMGEVDGITYITMPFIEGTTLAEVIAKQSLSVRETLHLARQIAAGLGAAHEAGVVHRDLKPENIMIDKDRNALIMDFGLALSTTATNAAEGIVGTLHYMAPEQAAGQAVDQRADMLLVRADPLRDAVEETASRGEVGAHRA